MFVKQFENSGDVDRSDNLRTQYAALCYRMDGNLPQVLLITSRTTKRWIIPKGWPMAKKSPLQTAQLEAWEEAGVVGKGQNTCIGMYSYLKIMEKGDDLPCMVMVYPVKVKSLARRFPERTERKRKWFTPKKAATKVAEPELAQILRAFDPRRPTG